MTEVQLRKLVEEAERRTRIKADTTLLSENVTIDLYCTEPNSTVNADVTIDLYSQEPSVHERFSVRHPKTQEQREEFIRTACEKLELLHQKRKHRLFN